MGNWAVPVGAALAGDVAAKEDWAGRAAVMAAAAARVARVEAVAG